MPEKIHDFHTIITKKNTIKKIHTERRVISNIDVNANDVRELVQCFESRDLIDHYRWHYYHYSLAHCYHYFGAADSTYWHKYLWFFVWWRNKKDFWHSFHLQIKIHRKYCGECILFRVNNDSCRPRSTISPSWTTRISSACIIVDRRWATIIVVRSVHTCDNAVWIFRSVCVSSDDVASSSRTMDGDFKIVRAKKKIEIRKHQINLYWSDVLLLLFHTYCNSLFFTTTQS